jgi:hypothetical protein
MHALYPRVATSVGSGTKRIDFLLSGKSNDGGFVVRKSCAHSICGSERPQVVVGRFEGQFVGNFEGHLLG